MFKLFIFIIYFSFIYCIPLKQPRTGYNEKTARALLNLAAGAYGVHPEQCVKKTFPSFNSHNQNTTTFSSQRKICDFFGNKCSSYHFADTVNHHLYIVFRGTSTKAQLLSEGWFSLDPSMDFYGLGKANKYFVNALRVLWPDVKSALEKYPNFKVTFTGHSLGGAMASLAALKTVHKELRNKNDVILYTFGQPRVGNVILAKNHDKLVPTSYRVVHSIDIVPHLPGCEKKEIMGADSHPCNPEHLEHPYHHGIEIYYPHEMHENNSTYIECLGDPKGEDYKCSDALTFKPEHHFQYIYAHTHYFEHKVSALGKLGCNGTKEQEADLPADYGKEKKEPSFRNVLKAVQFAATLFG